MDVTARGVTVRRGSFVLDVASFAADENGTALLGPNGAGKTTLLQSLHGLIPASGTIERPPRTASLFAQPIVLRGTVSWNVAVVCAAVLGVSARDAETRAASVLEDVGLERVSAADARTLSVGQRQRLALARALVVEPQALLLDEPFANIDADGRPPLRSLVRAYADRTAAALVVATSSLADAVALCRSAVVLAGGRVVHEGPVGSLATSGDAYAAALVAELLPRFSPSPHP